MFKFWNYNINFYILVFLLILCKNIISYTEELYLIVLYSILFIIFIEIGSLTIKNQIMTESFKLMEFYEKFVYLKEKFIIKARVYLIWTKKIKIIKGIIYTYFTILEEAKKILLENKSKIIKNKIYTILYYYLEEIKKNKKI